MPQEPGNGRMGLNGTIKTGFQVINFKTWINVGLVGFRYFEMIYDKNIFELMKSLQVHILNLNLNTYSFQDG